MMTNSPTFISERPIQAKISLKALQNNIEYVRSQAPNAKIMAIVKANGYGHGLLNVVQGLKSADGFGVLTLDSAVLLREAGYSQNILLLEGVFSAKEWKIIEQYRLVSVVHCFHQIESLTKSVESPLPIFLKINTGMNRLGFSLTEFPKAFAMVNQHVKISHVSLMSHLANADDIDELRRVCILFDKITQKLPCSRSLANSTALLQDHCTHFDWVRPGIMLYGSKPLPKTNGLQAVMRFTSQIIAIQNIQRGDSVGYGNAFTADKPMTIGVVACGYADGYPRHAKNGTPIAVDGQFTHLIGRVSMDMLTVNLSDIPQAKIGSLVEMWGEQISVDVVSNYSDTIAYELLCAVSARVPRILVD